MIAAVILITVVCFGVTARAGLKVGTGKVEITPELGCYLGGYYIASDTAKSVHDPLYARVIALNQGGKTVVLVQLDLVIMSGVMGTEIKDQVKERLGIPPEDVSITVIHTHTGPEGYYPEFGKYPKKNDPVMRKKIVDETTAAIEQAVKGMVPAKAGTVVIDLKGFSHNRHDPDGPVDPRGILLIAKDMKGKVIGGFLNFASHPTVVPVEQLKISADWPGVFTAELEKKTNGGAFLFLQSASGNISPAGMSGNDGWEEAADFGTRLAKTVSSKFDSVKVTSDFPVDARMQPVEFPVRKMKTVMEFAKGVNKRIEEINASNMSDDEKNLQIRWLRDRVGIENFMQPIIKTMSRAKGGVTHTWVQAMRLGDTMLIAFPGEAIAEYAIRAREDFAPTKLAVLGYTNDHLGYLTNQKVYEEGGYEAGMSLVYPEAVESMYDQVEALAREMTPAKETTKKKK